MAWAQSSPSSFFPHLQHEPLLKHQHLNEDPAAWVESIREDLPYFGEYFEGEETIDGTCERGKNYSTVLKALQRAIEGSLIGAYKQPPASILLQCIQHLKLGKKMYHGMRAYPFRTYKATEAKLENLNKLIRHVEGLLIGELSGHLQEDDPCVLIAASLGRDVPANGLPSYLMTLRENETISEKQFILSCCALIFKTDGNKPLFQDELWLLDALEQMNLYCGDYNQLKEMAFRLLKEEKISATAFVKVANLLLQEDSLSFIEIYRVLLQETLRCFESENKEHKKFARKRAARLDKFPEHLDLEEKKQLALQLCHNALWLETKLEFSFLDIALQWLEALYSDYSGDELPTEYQYLQNLKTFRRAHFQEKAAAKAAGEDFPVFSPSYQILGKFDAIVQDASFSEADKETVYGEANRLMENVLQPQPEQKETQEKTETPLDTLSFNVKRNARIFGFLERKAGIASMVTGAWLIAGGILGIAASITSAFVTLGIAAPLAFLGVWANLGLIGAGMVMIKGGQILRDAAGKQYEEARQAQKEWGEVCQNLKTLETPYRQPAFRDEPPDDDAYDEKGNGDSCSPSPRSLGF